MLPQIVSLPLPPLALSRTSQGACAARSIVSLPPGPSRHLPLLNATTVSSVGGIAARPPSRTGGIARHRSSHAGTGAKELFLAEQPGARPRPSVKKITQQHAKRAAAPHRSKRARE